jgi:hypothetical protein
MRKKSAQAASMQPFQPNNHKLMLLGLCLTILLSACQPAASGPAAPGPLGTPGNLSAIGL